MPRIEILFDKENKPNPSEKVRNALREQILQKIGDKIRTVSKKLPEPHSVHTCHETLQNDCIRS